MSTYINHSDKKRKGFPFFMTMYKLSVLWVLTWYLCFPDLRPQFVFSGPGPQGCIYRPWLIRIGNNKSQSLRVILLSLFLMSNSFVTVIVDRNETKSNFSKNHIIKGICFSRPSAPKPHKIFKCCF